MLSTSASATLRGIDGQRVQVEVHVVTGVLPSFSVVGLPDASCREARDRVRAALNSNGFKWPQQARVTVNLAPSQVRKEGSGLDLAIALGVIAASTLPEAKAQKEFDEGEPKTTRASAAASRVARGVWLCRRARPRRVTAIGAGHVVSGRCDR